jgi:16S rRNA U516 pseudouridylate synthase RsuA-like enzyme
MDEDSLNMAIRKFLKEVGVTSQREIERVVREGKVKGAALRLKMTLTSVDSASLDHVVEQTLELK